MLRTPVMVCVTALAVTTISRIGMGALRASLETMFKAIIGKELKTVAFGKPQLGTFQFATRVL
jgi:hypothetical protein